MLPALLLLFQTTPARAATDEVQRELHRPDMLWFRHEGRAIDRKMEGCWTEACDEYLSALRSMPELPPKVERRARDRILKGFATSEREVGDGRCRLRELAQAALQRLVDRQASSTDAGDLETLLRLVGDPQLALAAYDTLRERGVSSIELEGPLLPLVFDGLVAREGWPDILHDATDLLAFALRLVPDLEGFVYPERASFGCLFPLEQYRAAIDQLLAAERVWAALTLLLANGCWNTVLEFERELTRLYEPRVHALIVRANVEAGWCDRARQHLELMEKDLVDKYAKVLDLPCVRDARAAVEGCRSVEDR